MISLLILKVLSLSRLQVWVLNIERSIENSQKVKRYDRDNGYAEKPEQNVTHGNGSYHLKRRGGEKPNRAGMLLSRW